MKHRPGRDAVIDATADVAVGNRNTGERSHRPAAEEAATTVLTPLRFMTSFC